MPLNEIQTNKVVFELVVFVHTVYVRRLWHCLLVECIKQTPCRIVISARVIRITCRTVIWWKFYFHNGNVGWTIKVTALCLLQSCEVTFRRQMALIVQELRDACVPNQTGLYDWGRESEGGLQYWCCLSLALWMFTLLYEGGSWEAAIFSSGFIIPLSPLCVQLPPDVAF